MANILHRLTIDAPLQRVQELVATSEGLGSWWTGRPVVGDDTAFGCEVIAREPQRVAWRVVEGPQSWLDTRINFELAPREDGGTTLLFSHAGWREESEFMHGCSTNWAARSCLV